MRSFIPRLCLQWPTPQTALAAKLGGLPWGMPLGRWPCCRECGEPMTLIAQLPVRDGLDHADLLRGRDDLAEQVLHIFKCERDSICSFWEPRGGANKAFFLPLGDLRDGLVTRPDASTPILEDVLVESWTPHDDLVAADQAAMLMDYDAYWKLPEELAAPDGFDSRLRTKIGGVPY